MKKILLFILISTTVFGQAPKIEWNRAYGGSSYETAKGIMATQSGYIIHGNTGGYEYSTYPGDLDPSINIGQWVFTINHNGDIIDQTSILSYPTSDGGIIAVKDSLVRNEYTGTNSDIFIQKRDTDDDLEWERLYGGWPSGFNYDSGDDRFTKLLILPNGNLIILASTTSTNGDLDGLNGTWGNPSGWVFEIDKDDGSIKWQTVLHMGEDGYYSPFSILISGNDYLVLGKGIGNIALTLLNQEGVIKKESLFNLSRDNNFILTDIIRLDNGYVLALNSNSENGLFQSQYGNYDAVLIELGDSLQVIREKAIGGSGRDLINCIIPTDGGGFLATGTSFSYNHDLENVKRPYDYLDEEGYPYFISDDVWVLKFTNEFCIEWQGLYGGTGKDEGVKILSMNGGGYIVVGTTESNDGDVAKTHQFEYQDEDIWVLKLSAECDLNLELTSVTNPSVYGAFDGSIAFSTNVPDGSYTITYTFEEDSIIHEFSKTVSVSSGEFTINNLEAGAYYNFAIEYNDCVASLYSNSCTGPSQVTVEDGDIEGLPDYIHRYDPTTGKINDFARKAVILHPGTVIEAKNTGTYRAEVKDK